MQARLQFLNTGPDQLPGVIVMSLSDAVGENLDPNYDRVVVVFNGSAEEVSFAAEALAGREMTLHPVQAASADPIVAGSTWDAATGTLTVPGRTTAVFVQAEGTEPEPTPAPTAEPTAEPTATLAPMATAEPTAAPATTIEPTVLADLAAPEAEATPETADATSTTEEAGPTPAQPDLGRTEYAALAMIVIAGALGAAAGLIAWLRARREE